MSRIEATLAGAKQVWPALLASTVTAVIVFLPIVFMRDAVSQLFADLALTISIAVIASLVVAATALPLTASRWLNAENVHKGSDDKYRAVAGWIARHGVEIPDAESLRDWLKARLMPYQVPVRLLRLEDFPRTPSMKVDLPALRALFEAEPALP